MIRKAFVMQLHAGAAAEYARRHQPIWSDLAQVLRDHGVLSYRIFHDPATDQLFACVEIEDEARFDAIAATEPCRRWWTYMTDLMATNPDHSPARRDLVPVFDLGDQ